MIEMYTRLGYRGRRGEGRFFFLQNDGQEHGLEVVKLVGTLE